MFAPHDLRVQQHQRVVVQRRQRAGGAEPHLRGAGQCGAVHPFGQAAHVGQQRRQAGPAQSLVVGGQVEIVAGACQHTLHQRGHGHLAAQPQLVELEVGVAGAATLHLDHDIAIPFCQLLRRPALQGRPIGRQAGQHQRPAGGHKVAQQRVARDGHPAFHRNAARREHGHAVLLGHHRLQLVQPLCQALGRAKAGCRFDAADGVHRVGAGHPARHHGTHHAGHIAAEQPVLCDPVQPLSIDGR